MRGFRQTLSRMLAFTLVVAGCGGARAPVAKSQMTGEVAGPGPDPSARASGSVAGSARDIETRGVAVAPRADPQDDQASATARAGGETTARADATVIDEPIYFPGARARPKGSAVEASLDDEIIATWNRGGLTAEPTHGPKGKPAHAAPRVKVDVTEVRGDASEADMQRTARLKSYWPFRICYEQGLRRLQKLHGTIKLRLTIGPTGRPSGVQQLTAELGDAAVVSCVIKSAMGLGLPAPTSGAPQITLDISLWPGDEPVSIKSASRGKSLAPAEAKAITDQLRTHLPEARACYAAGLGRHEGLWGRLGLALHVTAGVVDQVNEVESHFPDAEVSECVQKAFLQSAVPSTDPDLTVVYPLRFGHAPDGRDARR
jgi:hypothetical protein